MNFLRLSRSLLFVCVFEFGKLSDLIFLVSLPTFQENCLEFLLLVFYSFLGIFHFRQMAVVMVVLLVVAEVTARVVVAAVARVMLW